MQENLESETLSQSEEFFSIELGDTFSEDQYSSYYQEAIKNGYTIKEIKSSEGKRRFQIVEPDNKPELTYIQKRLTEYPTVGDQLDMIYWDKVKGTNMWQEKIAEIKSKYPKE